MHRKETFLMLQIHISGCSSSGSPSVWLGMCGSGSQALQVQIHVPSKCLPCGWYFQGL